MVISIERMQEREKRAQEIDRDKVQLRVHEVFSAHICDIDNQHGLNEADHVAVRLVIYQSLDYSTRRIVNAALFGERENEWEQQADLYESLKQLTDQQYAYLIRMSVVGKSESKLPNHETGMCLYKIAEAAGTDVKAIEAEQQEKATVRREKQLEKIAALEKKISRMKPVE